MAKKKGPPNTSSIETRSFQKGMVKDVNESLMPEGAYIAARNAVNNSRSGDLGVLGNEASNTFCTNATYTIIGAIHIVADRWAIFSTDGTNSEIGDFNETSCGYTPIVNDVCLNFQKSNLIIGEAKENFDCTWQVYWADGLNPDGSMNLEKPAFIENCAPDPGDPSCILCVPTTDLDCERLRMARLTKQPCIKLEEGANGGELLNGTYQAVVGYTESEQRVSDYSIPSNLVSIFDHTNVNGSLDIIIEDIDQSYDEFELVIIGFVNQQLVARRMGIYSTHQARISIDRIDPALPAVPLQFIPIDRPSYEKSEGIYRNGEYLIRVAPTTKFSFNYQPLANKINTQWVNVQYPANYYSKGNANPGYLRDEVYSFFIRWIYNTNDKTESYHIPGRAPNPGETNTIPSPAYGTGFQFEEINTAGSTLFPPYSLPDGGLVIGKGDMAFWQSSEIYPDNNPTVWDDLCGEPIRHHKMPDSTISGALHFGSGGTINVLGVQFNNIAFPIDNAGNPIPGIVGYEILRGSREGNKTIVAKGLLNNMGAYNREDKSGIAYYQNYPYNDLRTDPFLNVTGFISGDKDNGGNQHAGLNDFRDDKFTFHSPDTAFKHPFLSSKEIRVYETHSGPVDGVFNEPYKHPDHKLVADLAFVLSALVGFGIATKALRGSSKTTRSSAFNRDTLEIPLAGSSTGGFNAIGAAANSPVVVAYNNAFVTGNSALEQTGVNDVALFTLGVTGDDIVNPNPASNFFSNTAAYTAGAVPGVNVNTTLEYSSTGESGLPAPLRIIQAMPTFLAYWSESTQAFIDLLKAFSRKHQYALSYESHCFHSNNSHQTNVRVGINEASYIGDRLQEFGGITINNLYRASCVGLITNSSLTRPLVTDTSRRTFKGSFSGPVSSDNVGKKIINGTASAYYVGLKSRLRNQYGQIDGIIQVPTGSCYKDWTIDINNPPNATSEVIFGGDTYIGRYTEKNTFFYFFDWMYDLPDQFEYDYRLRKMMPYPTYWMDTHDFQVNDFLTGIFDALAGVFGLGGGGIPILPGGWHNFDTSGNFTGVGGLASALTSIPPSLKLIVKEAYMYLFNSGVRDFIVESEVNVDYRDWGEEETQRFYDPRLHTDLQNMFRSDRIKSGNFFKYDYSLSASRYYQGYPSWGTTQYRNYDPFVAETCYSYYPNRVIYSLPQDKELRYDNWLAYLVNNYKDFTSRVTSIKPIGMNGAMMLFENEAPSLIPGVDVLQTTSGTKITIGDGGLFSQPLQHLVNSDDSYEYGSCQNRLSVINTPAGLFWISQNQGKIFNYVGQLEDISQQGMKWWFEEFLPYKITQSFPNFELTDNTVIGVGCQSIYDNSDGIVYFTKRDFKLRPEFEGRVTYISNDDFQVDNVGLFKLGDPRYFDNASWTVSYDPKAKAWISFHDWHPNFMLPSKNNFLSVANRGIWKHNDTHHSYCNFYGINYPFEVEFATPTGQTVNTLKSIEYQMEVYQWINDVDRNHVLDFNFDKAVIYNTEQISGELRLNLEAKNNPQNMLTYPRVNPSSIDILYSKVEQKYRFNQFWDVTDDRGEFTTARRAMFNTNPDGYTKEINPVNVNYNKAPTQRKSFRHYQSNLWLRRMVSGVHNMQLKLVNSKNQYSAR